MEPGFAIHDIDKLDSPSIAISIERVKYNIKKAIEICNVDLLRPHVKTFKTIEIVLLLIDEGVNKFKCATVAEAEMLAIAGAKDVLLAYQPVGTMLRRLKDLISTYERTSFSCLVDNEITARSLSSFFKNNPISVYIDLNCGMNRTGVKPEHFKLFLEKISGYEGIRVRGLHAYDGHINDLDEVKRNERAQLFFQTVETLQSSAEVFLDRKLSAVIGGSLNFIFYSTRKDIECSPGTFVFWDDGYGQYSDLPFVQAAVIITRVVSIVDNTTMCFDLGHKAVAAENPIDKRIRILGIDAKILSHSEEHIVISVQDSSRFKVGDTFFAVPFHICPTVALHQELYVVENDKCNVSWKVTGRNRKINW